MKLPFSTRNKVSVNLENLELMILKHMVSGLVHQAVDWWPHLTASSLHGLDCHDGFAQTDMQVVGATMCEFR